MKTIVFLIFIVTIFFSSCIKSKAPEPIPAANLSRDINAHQIHYPKLKKTLSTKGIDIDKIEVFLLAFKQEEKLEVWIKEKNQSTYSYFKNYKFCRNSGKLGPKRIEGDYQIPEGPYHINIYNPFSNFHLSLGINYPNASDKILSDREMPGGDIYIHGGCMTIGCIPITDPNIKELYTLASIAHQQGQTQIPVYIFPFFMSDENIEKWSKEFPQHQDFWKNIQPFFKQFLDHKTLKKFEINQEGNFIFN